SIPSRWKGPGKTLVLGLLYRHGPGDPDQRTRRSAGPAAGRDPVSVAHWPLAGSCPGMPPPARDGGIPPDRRAVVRRDGPAPRRRHYVAPLFPAAALLVASSWDRSLSTQGGRAGAVSFWLTLGVGCVLGLAFVGLDWAYERFNAQIAQEFPAAAQVDPGWAPMAIGFLILGGMGLFGYAALTAGREGLGFG